jgi:hypothetical protein
MPVARIGHGWPAQPQAAEVEVSLQKGETCSSGYLVAFIGAGITSVATILAFSDFGEVVAFFLSIVANHLDGFSKMAGMIGIDRRKRA